jgi:hypothetical protein
MYQIGPGNPILIPVMLLITLSIALFAIGLTLRRRGYLRGRGVTLVWALITVAPLFGSGLVFYLKHQAEIASGAVRSGQNYPPNAPHWLRAAARVRA